MPPLTIQEEKKLVLEAQKNSESFGKLYDLYFPKVFGFVASKVQDRSTAEDLVSDIFMKILENLPKFEWRGAPFGAWIFRIARNVLNDFYRSHSRKQTSDIDQVFGLKDETLLGSPAKQAGKNELQEIVGGVLKNLNETESEVVKLKFFSELSNQEIAKTLDLTETNVGVIIFRTLKKIKPDLELVKVTIENYMFMLCSFFI